VVIVISRLHNNNNLRKSVSKVFSVRPAITSRKYSLALWHFDSNLIFYFENFIKLYIYIVLDEIIQYEVSQE
jgi:hypothetical protein